MTFVNTPLDQFDIVSYISLHAPILHVCLPRNIYILVGISIISLVLFYNPLADLYRELGYKNKYKLDRLKKAKRTENIVKVEFFRTRLYPNKGDTILLYDDLDHNGLLLKKLLSHYGPMWRITADIPGEPSNRIYYTSGHRTNIIRNVFLIEESIEKGIEGVYLSQGLNLESDDTYTLVFNGDHELTTQNIKGKPLLLTGPMSSPKADLPSGSWRWSRSDI